MTVDNDASASATVVEAHAPDRVGTLYRITRALADLELDIRHAKVASATRWWAPSTWSMRRARKLTDPDHCREVERAILIELSRA